MATRNMLYDFKEYSPQKHEDKPYYANPRKYHPKHKASPLKSLYHKREDNEMEISKPITVNGQEVTKLELDFDKITGRDLVQSEVGHAPKATARRQSFFR